MLRAKVSVRRVIWTLAGLAVAGLAVVLYVVPTWSFLSQPAGEKWVETTASRLASTTAGAELETLADQLMEQHDQDALGLPEAEFSNGGRALPAERLPAKFRESGGIFTKPQLFVRLDADSKPEVLVVSWGHLRHGIFVYRAPPSEPPRGLSVRAASARTFVVAKEEWSSSVLEESSATRGQ